MTNIIEVAKHAGVSTASVSRYLNFPDTIRDDTKQKVKKAIAELNYTPSLIARGMRKQKSGYIALVVEDINNPFYTKVFDGAYSCASDNNYNIILLDSKRDKNEKFFLDILLGGRVEGVIYCISMNESDSEYLEDLQKSRIPVVLIDNELFKNKFTAVNTNNYEASYKGTEYLISKGHKNIILVCFNKFQDQINLRINGYKDALRAHKLKFDEKNIYETDLSVEGGENIAKKLLTGIDSYTAIFATSDAIAIGIIKQFNKNNIKIPDRVSILGFDNISWSEIIVPALTTVHQKSRKLGYLAVQKLIEKIAGKNKKNLLIELTTEIIERESVKHI